MPPELLSILVAVPLVCAGCSGEENIGSSGDGATSATSTSSGFSEDSGTTATSTSATADTSATIDPATTATSDTTQNCFVCPTEGDGDRPCNPWLQDCPRGQKCTPWAHGGASSLNSHKCVPVAPDPDSVDETCAAEGDGLSGIDSCDKGSFCYNVDPQTGTGYCVALCHGIEEQCVQDGSGCCSEGYHCKFEAGGATYCLLDCDPISQDCLDEGEACYPNPDDAQNFECDKTSASTGKIADPCYAHRMCDLGTFCGDSAGYPGCSPLSDCCIPFCELLSPECPAGTECVAWFESKPPVGHEDVGFCAIP